jgi:hypothetical protein
MEYLVFLWIGAVVLGPLILLLLLVWLGSKALKSLNPPERRDFLIGFFGIIILNALLYPLSLALRGGSTPPETRATMSLALPWVVNLALLIFFAFYRRWIALGALALVGSLLVWVVLSGVFLFASCYLLFSIAAIFGWLNIIWKSFVGSFTARY